MGKGIYDLNAFSQSVEGRFPENLILSHDLLEGCYARTGLVSDVEVIEEYPACYLADSRRRHRWIRGDWQIEPWLPAFVPDNSPKKQKNPLSALSRWKIFDNMRRSLVAPATFFLLLIAWTVLPDPRFWTMYITSLYLVPALVVCGWKVLRKPAEQTWMLHLYDVPRVIQDQLAVPLLTLAFLPYEAYISLDAVLRSCWRMVVSHRYLLEWTTHQEAGLAGNQDLAGFYWVMFPAPVIGAALLFGMAPLHPFANRSIGLFGLAWILAPAIAWWISRPRGTETIPLTSGQERFLRRVARRTWRFFETFVTAEDHYLPPDNYQEQPVVTLAHRTSPTDIGLSLLANLTAYDFGYIPAGELVDRTRKTVTSMGKLKRFRGHFYNWYDTITLEPQLPRYISTVDSGNLVGDLLVVRQGLYDLPGCQLLSKGFPGGLSDTLSLLSGAIDTATEKKKGEVPESVRSKIADLQERAARMPGTDHRNLRSALCS